MKLSFLPFLAFASMNLVMINANEDGSRNLRRTLKGGSPPPPPPPGDGSGHPPPPPPQAPGDLNIRFNKIPFPSGAPAGFLPLTGEDYPFSEETANILKTQSTAASIVTEHDYELHGARAQDFVNLIGGPPSMPNSDPNHEFWADFRHVVKVQLQRRDSVDPTTITTLPDLWKGFDIHEVAKAVHDEYPGYHQEELIKWLWSEGVEIDDSIVPFRSNLDFIGLQVRLADLNTWAIGAVAPINFHLKWWMGRPRPEEVAWKIATGELTAAHGVPDDIVSAIRSMELKNATDFTAYPEGSPVHPSWPAMHSAASSASLWLAVVLKDLTPAQYCEALRVDYAVSYARTVAGVHYPTDNIAGLNLGKEIMLDTLADHFVKKYGSDRAVVQSKLEHYSFDWANFDPVNCSTN